MFPADFSLILFGTTYDQEQKKNFLLENCPEFGGKYTFSYKKVHS